LSSTETNECGKGKSMLSRPLRVARKKPGPRPKYTREFLLSVPDLIMKDGLTLEQIATSVGGKPSTIVELCYRNKIALPSKRKHRIFARLRFTTIKRMQTEALARNITYCELAERLLEAIAQDNMFKAVLDD